MTTSTVTTKGQILIPKHIRERLNLTPRSTVVIEYDAQRDCAVITSGKDVVDRAGSIAPRKGTRVLDARDAYEQNYERS